MYITWVAQRATHRLSFNYYECTIYAKTQNAVEKFSNCVSLKSYITIKYACACFTYNYIRGRARRQANKLSSGKCKLSAQAFNSSKGAITSSERDREHRTVYIRTRDN